MNVKAYFLKEKKVADREVKVKICNSRLVRFIPEDYNVLRAT